MTERFSKLSLDGTNSIKSSLSDYDDIIHDYNSIHTSDNDSNNGNDDDDIKRNSPFVSSSGITNDNITTTTTTNTNTSPVTSTNIKRNGSTSSNYDKINANLHARVKAFQEQRALKRSTSSGANRKTSQERLVASSNNNNNTNNFISDDDIDRHDLSLDISSYTTSTSSASLVSKTLNKIVNKPLPALPNLSHGDSHNISRSTSISSVSSKDSCNSKNLENKDISTANVNNSIRSLMHPTVPSYNNFIQNISTKNLHRNNNNSNNSVNFEDTATPENLQSNDVLKPNTNNDGYDDKITSITKKHSRKISAKDFNLESYKEATILSNDNKRNMNVTTNTKDQSDKEAVNEQVTTTDSTDSSITNSTIVSMMATISNVQNTSNFVSQIPQQPNPNRRAPKKPVFTNMKAAIQTSQTNSTVQNRSPKQSLSARRGLKLPLGGMNLKMLTKSFPSTTTSSVHADSQEFAVSPVNKNNHILNHSSGRRLNPGSLINGIQTTSTSSSYDDNCDTEGTMPDNSSSNSSSLGSGGPGGLFSNFSKYVDIKSGSLNFAGKLSLSSKGIDFSNGSSSRITLDELEFLEELGHGNYGNVSKVLHKPTNVIMAMKEVRLELDEAKFRQILMELEVLHKCRSPYIVDFYGAFFIEGAVYMCIEYMDGGSLDKIYDQNPEIGGIDEPQLAYITDAVIRGLKELKEVHNIIHRDVKPTNILCSAQQGTIKLCDFGVSGNLVASMAKTNIGCQSYMAPERIKSLNPDIATYTVQSDIWSLGLSILEMALGRYPYPPETFNNIFSQLSAIVDGPPPKLPADKFSIEAQEFVALCLQKIPERRPTYSKLLEHPWLVKYRKVDVGMNQYVKERLEIKKRILDASGENVLPKIVPALHMGGLP